MKINLICNINDNQWILGKFARKLKEHLVLKGHDTEITTSIDFNADVNHYLLYLDYKYTPNLITTVMITHIDNSIKLNFLKAISPSSQLLKIKVQIKKLRIRFIFIIF